MLASSLVIIGVAAAVGSFALSVLIVASQRWHGRHSHDHDLEGVQKVHTEAVPRIGGLAVIGGMVIGIFLFDILYPGQISSSRKTKIFALLCASLPAFISGIIEDITKKVSVRIRLVATVCSALIASALLGATINELDIWGIDTLLRLTPVAIVVTAIVVAGGANAVNIIDGFNGLSGSVTVVMAAALGVVAWQAGDSFTAMLGALGVGATAGFLLMNYPMGKLFLGDGGAYFLGFWVSELAVLILVRDSAVNAWQVLSICAYPIIEVMFSIYRRKFIKNVNAGSADALHLHTLLYRRLVFRLFPSSTSRPWNRNAAVACLIVPWVVVAAYASVTAGKTVVGSISIVGVQVVVYILVYGRLVRGRWGPRVTRAIDLEAEKKNAQADCP
jgi:UDP-N-acetylmuramyl pentapeptide phosphotransferase/UDP-N-acetylglucosamine-1-phosphate transferase